jgi:hypothetical protein
MVLGAELFLWSSRIREDMQKISCYRLEDMKKISAIRPIWEDMQKISYYNSYVAR